MSSRYTSMSVQPEKKAKPVKSTMNQETVPLTSLSAIQVDPISEPKVTIPVVETKSESPIAEPEPAKEEDHSIYQNPELSIDNLLQAVDEEDN